MDASILLEKLKSNPFVLAPMAGITNAPFRRLMREQGAGIVVSELISATGLQYEGQKTLDLCRFFEEERPVGLQIFGENAEHLMFAAQKVEAMGCDFVDINLGCPVPKVVSKGAGSAMLRDPQKLFEILKAVKSVLKIPLTIKIRTGWDSSSRNALECIHAAAEAGVLWVAIHGRTRAQGYEGEADWEFIAKMKEQSPLPIIGNGDILTAPQAIQRLHDSGCDAIMIGRGALRNPFIFQEIAMLLSKEDRAINQSYWDLILRHYDLLQNSFGSFFTGIQLRKFMTWFSAGIEGASQFRKSLYEQSNDEAGTAAVLKLGELFFNRPGVSKCSSYLKEGFLQGGHG